ncbi:MAG TPA: hypothetical protein PLP30_08435 [Clostridia bacterium]|nr:hypothetical protein [Clostridia bacterium]HRX42177.1 hypothetical protein [Clostridia bacterium]
MNKEKKTIEIRLPAVGEHARILRLASAGAADACGFDVDMIEDVKVIVSEVFTSILEADGTDAVFGFIPSPGKLEVHIRTGSGEPVLKGANEMTLPILQALAGSVESDDEGGLKLVIEK